MKAPILFLLTVLSLSCGAFAADAKAANPKTVIAIAVLQEPMIRAAVKQWHHYGATCTHEVTKAVSWNNGSDGYDFEMRVDCQMPDGPDVGGGSTMYFIKGNYTDKTAILDEIKIERAG